MSAYRGRTGPNFSEYLNHLNSLSPYEEQQFGADGLELDQDLAMFTNTDFTHFDIPALPEGSAMEFDLTGEKPENVNYSELLGADAQTMTMPQTSRSSLDTPVYHATYNTPIQPAPSAGLAPSDRQLSLAPQSGGPARRKTESVDLDPMSPDDKSKVAAEEDKRRRNTAASARFRVKKKQREQALERSVKDINDTNSKLEAKVSQLEMENRWLKNLITEKNTIQSREEIEVAYEKFKRESEEREDGAEHTTGVGTE